MEVEIEYENKGILECVPIVVVVGFAVYGYIIHPGVYGFMTGILSGLICLLSGIPFVGYLIAIKCFGFAATHTPNPNAFTAIKPAFTIVSAILCGISTVVTVVLVVLVVWFKRKYMR